MANENKLNTDLADSIHTKYFGKKINYPDMMRDFLSYRNITDDYHEGKYRDLVIYMFGLGSGTAQKFLCVAKSVYAGLVADGSLNIYKAYTLIQKDNIYKQESLTIEKVEEKIKQLSNERNPRIKGIKAELIYCNYFNSLPGFTCHTTKPSKDKGVDMILTNPNDHSIAIQSKYGNSYKTISQNIVYEIYCGMKREKCDACAILTEAKFSPEGEKASEDLGVDHYCIKTLSNFYNKYKNF